MSSGPTTLASRLLFPFLRVCGNDPRTLKVAVDEGLDFTLLVQSDARIPHGLAMRVLSRLVTETAEPALGLKAGMAVVQSDLDVFGDMVSSQLTLRAAAECVVRYYRVLHTGAALELLREGDCAMWRYRLVDGVEEPPAAHDFVVSCISTCVRLLTGRDEPKLAVHVSHEDRSNLETYKRLFRCPIKFGMPFTGVLFPAERLDWPLQQPTVLLGEAFEARMRDRLAEVGEQLTTAGLVRQTLSTHMSSGDISMTSVARRLGFSVPTLRRQLAAENTTHSAILDEVRKQLALSMLERGELSAAKIALSLRFSNAAAFHRAFRRWTGTTPSAYRRSTR